MDPHGARSAFQFRSRETFPEREVEIMIRHESGELGQDIVGRTTSLSLLHRFLFFTLLPANP
jgi:hypothetical protein